MFLRNLRSIFHSNNCIAIAAICKDYIITTARFFLYFSTRILQKKRQWFLRGFPAYEDNLISIYAALTARGSTKIVWVVDDVLDNPPVPIDKNTRLVRRGSVLDIYYSITSRFLFITHGHFLRKIPPNQVCVNLWHGDTI
jgi:hypothetical protein